MRRTGTLVALIAGLVSASAALAVTGESAYLGLRGSFAWTEDTEADSAQTGVNIEDTDSFGGGAALGYEFDNGLRIEGEFFYLTSEVETFEVTKDLINVPDLVGDRFDVNGDLSVAAIMANVYYDIPLDHFAFKPYVGGGIGAAAIMADMDSGPLLVAFDETSWTFAWQVMAGVSMPIDEGIVASAGYRYFAATETDMPDAFGDDYSFSVSSHSFDVGLRFRF